MDLNYDCVRQTLLTLVELTKLNDKYEFETINFKMICGNENIRDFGDKDIFYSPYNLHQIGFIEGIVEQSGLRRIFLYNVTMRGHQFLELIKEPTTWGKTKTILWKVGNHSLKFIEDTAQQIAVECSKSMLGLH